MRIRREPALATATIASGGTVSSAIDIREYAIFGMVIPAAFTGIAITFQVCATSGGTFQGLYNTSGNAVSVTVAQGRSYDVPTEVASWPYVKLVSGSAEAADRTLTLVMKG